MEEIKETTVIVTGSVRSGTSAMMKALHDAGVKVLFDDEKKPADISNPNGYFEYPQVNKLRFSSPRFIESRKNRQREEIERMLQNVPESIREKTRERHLKRLEEIHSITPEQRAQHLERINKSREEKGLPPIPFQDLENKWLDEIKGGAVKILPNDLLQDLPLDRKYAVIFMKRDFSEVAESFYSYLTNRPILSEAVVKSAKEDLIKEYEEKFSKNSQEALDYLKSHPENFSIIEVETSKMSEQIADVSRFVSDNIGSEVNLIIPPKGS